MLHNCVAFNGLLNFQFVMDLYKIHLCAYHMQAISTHCESRSALLHRRDQEPKPLPPSHVFPEIVLEAVVGHLRKGWTTIN